jgi:hypothetical protein
MFEDRQDSRQTPEAWRGTKVAAIALGYGGPVPIDYLPAK